MIHTTEIPKAFHLFEKNKILCLLLIFSILTTEEGFSVVPGLQADTLEISKQKKSAERPSPIHRNVIKINPTPMLLFSNVRNLTLSYERVLGKDMSVSLQAGLLIFPKLLSDTILGLVAISPGKKYGVNLAFDFRYYPLSRNRRPAPDGLYLGAYLSYYGFNFTNNMDILHTTLDQNGSIYGRLNIINLGVSLGYQFIFWKRFTLDLLMFGPAVSRYNGTLGISGNLDPSQIQDIDEELVKELLDKFPWLNTLFSPQKLEFTGSNTKISFGLRYSIQIGIHF